MYLVATLIILILLIILYFYKFGSAEYLSDPDFSYIKLYSKFEYKEPWFEMQTAGTPQYIKKMMKVDLKSFDIKLMDYKDTPYNQIRIVEIWNVYDGSNTASLESDFYDSYLEPHYALRANPAKYELIARVLPGEHVKTNVDKPIKKIILIAII